jgi:hypothetical protein
MDLQHYLHRLHLELGDYSPAVLHYLHWLHLETTHPLYYTICTGYTWSPLTRCTTLSALATLGDHSPTVLHYLHWLHLETTHLLYYTICTGYTWRLLTSPDAHTAICTGYTWRLLTSPDVHTAICTGYTWRLLTRCTTLSALATLGDYSPVPTYTQQFATGATPCGWDPTDIWYSGWDPSAQSEESKSEQVKHCIDLVHCVHGAHWLDLEPTHLVVGTQV